VTGRSTTRWAIRTASRYCARGPAAVVPPAAQQRHGRKQT